MFTGEGTVDGEPEYIVFNPTQIKSIYNEGTFNEYDPNINYQLKELKEGLQQYSLEAGNTTFNQFIQGDTSQSVQYTTEKSSNGLTGLLINNEVDIDLVVKDAVMGGYDYLKMVDNEPIVISNGMIEKVLSEKPLFQLKEEGSNGKLLAMHNITEAKLRNILKLGGIPGPSIAITTVDRTIDSFGDISLIFNKDSIDPRRKTNNVFAADVYSPRYPKVKIEIDRNAQVWDKFKDEIGSNEIFNLQEWLTMDRPPLDHDVMRKMYLMDKGLPNTLKTWKMDEQTLNDYATWTDDILAQANYQRLIGVPEQESYYASGVRNYTTNKYIPETLDNVLKVMKKQSIRGGEGGQYVGRVRALAAKQFKSIKDIKAHEYLLENEIEEVKEQVNEQQYQAEKILMKYSGYERGFDEIYDTFNNYYNIADSRSIEGMQQALNMLDEKMYGNVSEDDLNELVGYADG